ncbi:MAG: BatA and WFA domain-containing protein [Verrucomicrobiales bacterium]
MTFLAPWFGWAFLSLIPLAAIYLLKVRPRRKTTTAYFLWEKIFAQKQSSALFSRLRDLWSLILLLLAFCSVILALMKPESKNDGRKDLLILIDQSASMSARDGGSTRLEQALDEARGMIRALDGSQRAAVAGVAQDVEFVSHLTDSPRELMDALAKIQPTQLPLNRKAIQSIFTEGDHSDDRRYRVLLVSDGSATGDPLGDDIELLKVGTAAENIGIVAADARVIPGADAGVSVYLQLSSSFSGAKEVEVIFKSHGDEAVGKIVPIRVEPGLNRPEIFSVEGFGAGKYEVVLDLEDALASDNTAALAPQKPNPVAVSVSTADQFFFENSVQAFARSGGLLQLVATGAQLAIGKGTAPDAELALVFQPEGSSPWWSDVGEEVEAPLPEVQLKDHPVLRLLDAASISFLGARQLTAPDGALVLVASDQGIPLIYVARGGGRSAVVVNMDPVAAEFYYSAWFPVLVHGAATYLAGREEELSASYATGARITIPGAREGDVTTATAPSSAEPVAISGKSYGPLTAPGFYELKNAAGTWPIAVSLLAPGESQLDNSLVVDNTKPLPRGWSPAFLLTALAIIVLCVESILYHRRKVG